MHGRSIYTRYTPGYIPSTPDPNTARWFVFRKDQILTRTVANTPEIPDQDILEYFNIEPEYRHYLGQLDHDGCYCVSVPSDAEPPEGYEFLNLRAFGSLVDEEVFMLAGRASQILHWDRLSRYCGRCGAPTRMKEDERAKKCDTCGNVIYPRISPAIIIAIIRDDQILLAHNRNFKPGLYSVLAGFMEPGEEFEDTARREVFEEVGIRIKNIHYFASQPWPFPDSLMVGFFGEYDSGELRVDGVEIEHADWFYREHLPEIPNTVSISGRLIRWFRDHPDPLHDLPHG